MKRKLWSFISIVAIMLLVVSGCSSNSTSTSTTTEDPLEDGVLSVAVDDTYLPMEFRDDENNLVGFDIDLIEALGEKLGVETDIQTVAWDGIFTGLEANQYDVIISSTSITPERQQSYSQSDPYISNGIVIVSNANTDEKADTFEELDGKTVGVQIETSADIAAQKLLEETGADVTIKQYDGMLDAFAALEGQQIDYVITDVGVAEYYANQSPEVFTITTDEPFTNEPIGVTATKENVELIEKINEALKELHEDGTLTKISEKWFGTDMTSEIDTTLNVIE